MDPDRTPNGGLAVRAGLAGAAAGGLGLGLSELAAGLLPGAPSLVVAIADLIVALQPPGAKDAVVALFGENDKLVVGIAIVVGAIMIAFGLGLVGLRRPGLASLGFVGVGLVSFFASLQQPFTSPALAVANVALAVFASIRAFEWLLARLGPRAAPGTVRAQMPDWSRRRFLVRFGGIAGAAIVVGGLGRFLLEGQHADSAAAAVRIPPPAGPSPIVPAGGQLDVPGITPIVVGNDEFYRIDTAFLTPIVDPDTWQLRVHGMVDQELTLTFDQLVSLPLVEQFVTIACVSNEVGGNLVGNALWRGVRLKEVLEMAGVRTGATQIVGRSVDGWTAGFPTEHALAEGREPLIAVEMNGAPLPAAHGFPARLIVPGLYGYVSATKWLTEIELTTIEGFDGYWVPLGWAKNGPILTQARIDVPRQGSTVRPGPTAIAGVAWAPDRGISRVEVAVDGDWREAELSAAISAATWVQWRLEWNSTPGDHTIEVRATDGRGETQPAERTPPAPDGARGHHTIRVGVA